MEGSRAQRSHPAQPSQRTFASFPKQLSWLVVILWTRAFIELKFNGSTSELCKLITIRVDGLFCFDALIGGLPGWGWARRISAPEALAWMIPENARPVTVNAKVVRHR